MRRTMGFFLNPIGLVALLAVPAVIAIHLFRRRFRPHVVSALFLWRDPDRTALSGRKPERLRASASLFLEVAAAALLALAFAGLKLPGSGEAAHLVAVLDESASMDARGGENEGESAADRARAVVRERIASLPRGSRVTLVASGSRPRLLAGPASFPSEAEERLGAYSPRAAGHDLLPAVALALEIAAGGDVLVVTDRFEPAPFPPEVELLSVGEPHDNAAIAHAARAVETDRETGESKERLRLTIANGTARPRESAPPRRLVIRASGAGAPLLERPVEFAPGESRASFSVDLPPGAPALEIALEPPDALAIDDRAFLSPAPPRPIAIASALTADEERLLGFSRAERRLDRLLALVPDARATSDLAAADLVLAPKPVAAPERAWVLSIESGESSARADYLPPFLAEKRHPLLDGVTLDGIVWSASADVALAGGIPLVSAGNVPLVAESPPGERRLFRMNLDPARSTLARSPDWPILLANLLEMRRRELPGPERMNLVSGEPLVFRSDGEATYALERDGEPARECRARGALVIDDPGPPGFVTLRTSGAGAFVYAIRFADPAESDLTALRPGRRPAAGRPPVVATGASGLAESLLLAAALLAVLLDWFVLARRPRPAPDRRLA